MGKFEKIFLMAALCFAVGAFLFPQVLRAEIGEEGEYIGPTTDDDDEPSLSPRSSYPELDNLGEPELPPEPSPGFYKFLEQCATNMDVECSKEIFAGMFKEYTLSKTCCTRLVEDLGKECHDGIVKVLLTTPELKPSASKALLKSQQIWNACADASSLSPF